MVSAARGLSPNFSRRRVVRKAVVRSGGGVVVSQNRGASEAGARVLANGGHAVDAAIAASFAVGVLEPWMSGIGGVGAMLVRNAFDDKVTVIDFGARSPVALDPNDYPIEEGADADLFGWPKVKDDRNLVGACAVVAPTLVAGLAEAHGIFGRKMWRDLVMPAAILAGKGLVVDWHTSLTITTAFAHLARDPGARSIFLPGGSVPLPPQATATEATVRLPNAALARTLGTIAAEGSKAVYHGEIGRALRSDIRQAGGILSTHDLAACEARVTAPRTVRRRDHIVHVLPALSGGPTLIDAFNVLRDAWPGYGWSAPLNAEGFVAIAGALGEAWARRFAGMGDTASTAPQGSTTHISVVDREGNMVALTQTLLSVFGARYLSPSTGTLMNNAINWFDPRPGGPNSLAPAKRALSNYCPAIMLGDDDAIAIGGSGGRKIIPAVFQLLTMLAEGQSLEDAFHSPRIDVSGEDKVVVDRDLPEDIRAALAAQFATIAAERTPYPNLFGLIGAVRRRGDISEGATEPQHPWSEAVAEEEV